MTTIELETERSRLETRLIQLEEMISQNMGSSDVDDEYYEVNYRISAINKIIKGARG